MQKPPAQANAAPTDEVHGLQVSETADTLNRSWFPKHSAFQRCPRGCDMAAPVAPNPPRNLILVRLEHCTAQHVVSAGLTFLVDLIIPWSVR
jgi:hypothetical protein